MYQSTWLCGVAAKRRTSDLDVIGRGAKQGGGGWRDLNPPEFWMGGWTPVNPSPPDFEKKFFRGGWLPLNWSNYIVYVLLSI